MSEAENSASADEPAASAPAPSEPTDASPPPPPAIDVVSAEDSPPAWSPVNSLPPRQPAAGWATRDGGAVGLAAAKNHAAVVRLLPGGTHNWEGRNAKGVPCVKCAKVVGVGREGCWCGRRLETQLDSIPTQPTATRTSYRGLYHWEGFAADAPIEVR